MQVFKLQRKYPQLDQQELVSGRGGTLKAGVALLKARLMHLAFSRASYANQMGLVSSFKFVYLFLPLLQLID